MINPQIGLFYALTLLRIHRLPALGLSAGLLISLSAMALAHIDTSLSALLSTWFGALDVFVAKHNINILAGLLPFLSKMPALILLIILAAVSQIAIRLGNWLARRAEQSPRIDLLDLAGVSVILGDVSFYHVVYDKIMLYPALLACLRISCRNPLPWNLLLSALMAATVWMPKRVLDAVPGSMALQALIWSIVGIVLALQITTQGGRIRTEPTLSTSAALLVGMHRDRNPHGRTDSKSQ